MIAHPHSVSAPHPTLPSQIARSRATECIPAMLGSGSRMEVYPLVDEQTVLRVPIRTEARLIGEFGSSGRSALATGHEVSTTTETELHDLEQAEAYIGSFVPDTAPFADLDLDGAFRYYALQRRVRPIEDLRKCKSRPESRVTRGSLERFIRDVRDMVDNVGLIPDLLGHGNLVLDRFGLVKLVDINNFRRVISDDELAAALPDDLDDFATGARDIRKVLPEGFLDDEGLPIADLGLGVLRRLETRGLGRDHRDLDRDPFYSSTTDSRRLIVLGLLRSDLA